MVFFFDMNVGMRGDVKWGLTFTVIKIAAYIPFRTNNSRGTPIGVAPAIVQL